jgi:RNA polymerase sigma-70 factor (ECF subfamily)
MRAGWLSGNNPGFALRTSFPVTEDEALRSIRAGGRALEKGVRALYQEAGSAMLRFFIHRGVSADEAKDILQETMVRIVRGAGSYSGEGSARSWIWQVARNCLNDHLRKIQRLAQHESVFDDAAWQRLEEVTPGSADCPTDGSLEDCVAGGIGAWRAQMPDRAYALTLQMEGASIEEIASRIGRTAAATRQYLSQCRQKLQPFIAHCTEHLSASPT